MLWSPLINLNSDLDGKELKPETVWTTSATELQEWWHSTLWPFQSLLMLLKHSCSEFRSIISTYPHEQWSATCNMQRKPENNDLWGFFFFIFLFCNKQYFNDCWILSVSVSFLKDMDIQIFSPEISWKPFVFTVCSREGVRRDVLYVCTKDVFWFRGLPVRSTSSFSSVQSFLSARWLSSWCRGQVEFTYAAVMRLWGDAVWLQDNCAAAAAGDDDDDDSCNEGWEWRWWQRHGWEDDLRCL